MKLNTQYMVVTMPDSSNWQVPVSAIARNHAAYYANKHGTDIETELTERTIPLFNGNEADIEDWAENNMNWSDISQFAKQVTAGKVDYDDGWVNGDKMFGEAAAAIHPSPLNDRRWTSLVAKYQSDWSLAIQDLFGLTMTAQQKQVIDAISAPGAMVSVATGSGTGTTTVLAAIALIRPLLYPQGSTIIPVMANDGSQQEIQKHMASMWGMALVNQPWLGALFCLTENGFRANCNQGSSQKTENKAR
ncbi:hypothetical protein N0P70_005498 [Klebsiella michiganensis]|nr:hypothetical protein [Klebsiella michiganensis]